MGKPNHRQKAYIRFYVISVKCKQLDDKQALASVDPRWIKTDDKADRDKKIDLQKNRQTEKRQKTC